MLLNKIVLSKTPPTSPNTVWAKPSNGGVSLYTYSNNEWGPILSMDDMGTDDPSDDLPGKVITQQLFDETILDLKDYVSENYASNTEVSQIISRLNTLVGADEEGHEIDVTSIIDTFNEIKDFLANIEDTTLIELFDLVNTRINTLTQQVSNTLLLVGIDDIPEFDSTKNYSTNDLVIYSDKLYKFIETHSAGAWIGTDTLETDLIKEIGQTYSLVESVNNALDALNPDQQEALGVATKANANEAKLGYYVCDTNAATAAKTITATGYVLTTGGNIRIKMTNANTADAVTLNINNTGAKALFYNGEQASSTNTWEAGEVIEVYYDGSNYQTSNIQGGRKVPAGNVYINDTPLVSFFYAYQNYNVEDIFTAIRKYVYGSVGQTIREGNYTNLQYGRVPITYGDVFSITASGFQEGKGFFITDSDLKILEVSNTNVSVVNYKVTHSSAAYLYINNTISSQSSFRFSKAYISPDLDNDYSGGERRIPSAESVKKLHDALSVDTKSITVHIEQSGKAGSFYTDYYPLPYYADATSVITINNVSIISSGNAQIEFSNGDRTDGQGVLIRTGSTYSVTLNKRCSVISIWSNADFSCDVNITFKLHDWIKPFPCYGLKVATLGDSITAISNCNIGQLLTVYLHAHLIDNFAVGSAYAADLNNTEIDFTYRQGVYTANNVLSNQVRRLLRWTTPEGEQITWTHPIDGTFSIDTSIGTGLGHTDDIPDIIYIAIGINDAPDKIDTDLEAIVTASYSDLSRLTMGSAYRWAIETLQSAYPNAMILLASPLFISSQAHALSITKKGDIVKYVCASVGVDYIPSREESGYTNLIAKNNGGLHPNRVWSYNIAKFVAKNIEDKYVNSWRYNDSQSNE